MKTSLKKNMQTVLIILQDYDAIGKVYVKLAARLPANEIILEAMKELEEGPIYTDTHCRLPIEDEYIEINQRRPNKKNEDFVFLIHRSMAKEYITAMKIIK
jgi:uncharacterized UPF0160 family protein